MRLFGRSKGAGTKERRETGLWVLYTSTSAEYWVRNDSPDLEALSVASPLAVHYLNDLAAEGFAEEREDLYELTWDVLYQLRADPAHFEGLRELGLPPIGALRPILRSENTLDD